MKYETVTGPFSAFYDPMKAIYDELMAKHGGDFDKVRAEMPKVNYVVSSLPKYIREALGTMAESLWFSAEDFAKQLNHHPELTITEYANVFNKIKDCTEIYESGALKVALITEYERPYVVILKTTGNHSEAYIVSLHTSRSGYLKRIRKHKRLC